MDDITRQLRESCFCEGRGCELCRAADEIDRLRRAEGHAVATALGQQETIERLRAELICVCNLLVYLGRHAEDGKYCEICEVVARARKIAAARKGERESE